VSQWDGTTLTEMSGGPAFHSVVISRLSDYIDVEIDATDPYKTGVIEVSPTLLSPGRLMGRSYKTIGFNLATLYSAYRVSSRFM
jgi:hypothetical protein